MLLVINERKELMVISRQHPNGGQPLKGFPIQVDPETGLLGYKLGNTNCECGRTESLYIRTVDLGDCLKHFGISLAEYQNMVDNFKPKTSVKDRIGLLLGRRGLD